MKRVLVISLSAFLGFIFSSCGPKGKSDKNLPYYGTVYKYNWDYQIKEGDDNGSGQKYKYSYGLYVDGDAATLGHDFKLHIENVGDEITEVVKLKLKNPEKLKETIMTCSGMSCPDKVCYELIELEFDPTGTLSQFTNPKVSKTLIGSTSPGVNKDSFKDFIYIITKEGKRKGRVILRISTSSGYID